MGKADLHIHTRYGDGMATVRDVLDHVEHATDLDVIAITEHDTLRAAEQAREMHAQRSHRFGLVVGEEVTTLDGHLLALFIDKPVPSFRRMEATLEAIHEQGGLAIVPHPLSFLTRSANARVLDRIAQDPGDGVHFDGIEEYNLSPAGRVTSARARRLNRERLHLAGVGCSDAHFLASIGRAYTRFDGTTPGELRAAIEAKTTEGAAGPAPRMRELGYRNIALQSWRGMMATPRNMGWVPTIRSFIVSRARYRHAGSTRGEDARREDASP